MASPKPSVSEAFRKTVGFLENEQVPFVVVGGLAASLQGEPRYTDDANFMITLSSKDIYRFAERAKAEGFDIEPDLAEKQWRGSGFVRLWLGATGRQTAVDLMAESLKKSVQLGKIEPGRRCDLNSDGLAFRRIVDEESSLGGRGSLRPHPGTWH